MPTGSACEPQPCTCCTGGFITPKPPSSYTRCNLAHNLNTPSPQAASNLQTRPTDDKEYEAKRLMAKSSTHALVPALFSTSVPLFCIYILCNHGETARPGTRPQEAAKRSSRGRGPNLGLESGVRRFVFAVSKLNCPGPASRNGGLESLCENSDSLVRARFQPCRKRPRIATASAAGVRSDDSARRDANRGSYRP